MTVEGFGEQASGRRLADAARTAKQIGVMQPLMLDGVPERARNRLLTRHFIEGLGSPFACDNLIRHKKSDE